MDERHEEFADDSPATSVPGSRSLFLVYTAAFLLTGAVLLTLTGHLHRSYRTMETTLSQETGLKDLAGTVVHLDEVLTMSARMAAATGDPAWEQRYRRYEPKLESALRKAIRMAPELYIGQLANQTSEANMKLVDMENQAFEQIHQGRLPEAQAILFSQAYDTQKQIYAKGIKRLSSYLKKRADLRLAREHRRILFSGALAVVVFPVLIAAWAWVFRILRHWHRTVERASRQLSVRGRQFFELSRTLDQKVIERTAELLNTNQKLEREIAERKRTEETLEDQKDKLQEVNKRLEELSVLKDEFLAKVSHELRTPLTAVKEGVGLMKEGALGIVNEEQRDFLSTIDQEADRLTGLISDLLDLSKIGAGRLQLSRSRLNLGALIESVVKQYKMIAGGRTLKTELGAVPDVFADSNRILQVAGNLFANAIKFTRYDGTITFRLAHDKGRVSVSIQDDGVGIAQKDIPKLFYKFSQVGEGINLRRGTGLGLALSKELVELHKGCVSVSSEFGKGSTFTFELPVYTDRFALEESFQDMLESIKGSEQLQVGLIAFDGSAFQSALTAQPSNGFSWLERLADELRKQIHRGDVVLAMEPRWVTVLAVADREGMTALGKRLTKAATLALPFGFALYPEDGNKVEGLFAKATHGCQA